MQMDQYMYVTSQWRILGCERVGLSSFVVVICTADANEDISVYSGLISINKSYRVCTCLQLCGGEKWSWS